MGIEINLDPNIATFGAVTLSWHGVFTAVGVLVGVFLAGRLAVKRGIKEDDVYTMALYVVIGGIVGARLLFVIENWERLGFQRNLLSILAVNEGGISVIGAVIGAVVAGYIGTRIHKLDFAGIADVAAAPAALGLAIGRIGDIINGEHLGTPAPGFPLGVYFTHPNTLDQRCNTARLLDPEAICEPVHLAVAYEMIYLIAGAAFLVWLLNRTGTPKGAVFLWFVLIYSVGRFWTTFFRMDSPLFAGSPFTAPIALSVLGAVVAIIWLLVLRVPPPESRQVQRARARRQRTGSGSPPDED